MYSLPKVMVGGFILLILVLPRSAEAVTIASQTQVVSDQLITNRVLQELGNNLSGIASFFTFRVSTTRTNLNQFNFTVQNTRIFDKDNNNFSIVPCTPSNYNPSDPLGGLTFNSVGVPDGYEDVTLDFSCRNYNFISGHRYLIVFGSANYSQGSGLMLLAAAAYGSGGHGGSIDQFSGGGLRYSNGNKFDFSHNSGVCSGIYYIWGDLTPNPSSGCNIWTSAKDDLYFVLNNNAPPPRLPVVFIPGIGGSELKASQDIVWSKDDGHGGTFSHGYSNNEKIWVNQDEAAKLGDDDYFDVLRLKSDGVTSEASLNLTENMNPYGYSEIDSFFTGMGYVKNTNYFVFNYDWRKDVRSTRDDLDSLIESAKSASAQPKVNLVVHSMGGLIARYYISDPNKAAKVNKLIELGVPHLGSPWATKALMYGAQIGPSYLFGLVALNAKEVKDIVQNLTSNFQLLPSNKYYDFYNNSTDLPYPFRDDQDIDNNNTTGSLTYDQTKSLLSNLSYNMTVFNIGEQFHNSLDSALNQTNGTKVYEIVGTAQPTLGQIYETWWITWPINLIPKTDEIYINGDATVPLYSASLKSDSQDLSGATKIYYVEQKHGDMPSTNGISMQTVKSILNDDNTLPLEVKDQKINLEGDQISLDDGELDLYDDQNRHCGLNANGEMEENIPDVSCSTSSNTKHAFVKKKAAKIKVTATRKKASTSSKTTNIKKRTYRQDKISKTTLYKDVSIPATGKVEFTLDPAVDISPSLTLYPDSTKTDNSIINLTSEATGSAALDQTTPTTKIDVSGTKDSSGIYSDPVTVTLTGNDSGSGILRIEYSLDNGVTVQTYSEPFIISTPGKTTLQVKAIDKVGNEENPQTIIIEIAVPPTPTPTPTSTPASSTSSSGSSDSSYSTSNATSANTTVSSAADTSKVGFDSFEVGGSARTENNPSVLGISFENPSHISDQINITKVLDKPKNIGYSAKEILSGLLMISGGILTLACLGFIITFLKPFPAKM